MTLILRAHHLLCLQGFQGYGYDAKFVENMKRINELRKDDETQIKVVSKDDDICVSCPNLKNGMCQDVNENNKIISMDLKVLEKIPSKESFNSKELFGIINEQFNSINSVEGICLNCRWWDKCLFVKTLENRKL